MRLSLACLIATLCGVSPCVSAQVVIISEAVVERRADPGESYTGVIQLRNSTTQPLDARIYQTDYMFYADGRNIFGVAGSVPRSNARWLTFTPDYVTVPAGQTIPVQYSVTVPKGGSPLVGTFWSMLMVETVAPGSPESVQKAGADPRLGLRTTTRYGTQIVTHVATTGRMELAFANVAVAPSRAGSDATLSLDVTNAGDRGARARMSLELYDSAGQLVAKREQQRGLLYPGTSLRQEFKLGTLRTGAYKAMVLADAGGDEIFAGEFDVRY